MTTLIKMTGLQLAEAVYDAMLKVIDNCEDSAYILVEGFSRNKCTGYHFNMFPRRCTVVNNPVSDEIRIVYGMDNEFQRDTNWADDSVRFLDLDPGNMTKAAQSVYAWLAHAIDPVTGTQSPADLVTYGQRKPTPDVYIWWTNQGDCEGFIRYHEPIRAEGSMPWGGPIPEYIWDEITSRWRRGARGRLWVSTAHPELDVSIASAFKTDDNFHHYISNYCGGVPILARDLDVMQRNQGFVTDLSLNLIIKEEHRVVPSL